MVVRARGENGADALRAPVVGDPENLRRVPGQLFDTAEEEQPVPHDRPAKKRAEALLAERCRLIEVIGAAVGERACKRRAVKRPIAEEAVDAALEPVAAAARDHVQDAA